MHPKKIIRYFSLNPFEVKKLAQILLGREYKVNTIHPFGDEKPDLKQLFKDIKKLNGIQLQWTDKDKDMLEGDKGYALGNIYVWVGEYISAGAAHPKGELGIHVEYVYQQGGKQGEKEMQYASFAYTGDTDQRFSINWRTQPGK
jgi:hypothetical protein